MNVSFESVFFTDTFNPLSALPSSPQMEENAQNVEALVQSRGLFSGESPPTVGDISDRNWKRKQMEPSQAPPLPSAKAARTNDQAERIIERLCQDPAIATTTARQLCSDILKLQPELLSFDKIEKIIELLFTSQFLVINRRMKTTYLGMHEGQKILTHLLSKNQLDLRQKEPLYGMMRDLLEVGGGNITWWVRKAAPEIDDFTFHPTQLSARLRSYASQRIDEILNNPKPLLQAQFVKLCGIIDFHSVTDSELEKWVHLLLNIHLSQVQTRARPTYLRVDRALLFLKAALSKANKERSNRVFTQISLLIDSVQEQKELRRGCAQLASDLGVSLPEPLDPTLRLKRAAPARRQSSPNPKKKPTPSEPNFPKSQRVAKIIGSPLKASLLAQEMKKLRPELLSFQETAQIIDFLLSSHLLIVEREVKGTYITLAQGLDILKHLLSDRVESSLYERVQGFAEVMGTSTAGRIRKALPKLKDFQPDPDGGPSSHARKYALQRIVYILETPKRSLQVQFMGLCKIADLSLLDASELRRLMTLLFTNHLNRKNTRPKDPMYLKERPAIAFLDAVLLKASPEKAKEVFSQIASLIDGVLPEYKEPLKEECVRLARSLKTPLPKKLIP